MNPAKIVRLMNCAQVRVKQLGVDYDIRAQCVEVGQYDDRAVVVMTTLYTRDSECVVTPKNPLLMGKITIPGRVRIVDALDLDYICWGIVGDTVELTVRPHQDESIWVDHAFSGGDLPQDLRKLYDDQRLYMASLIAHKRFLRSAPNGNKEVREIHEHTIANLEKVLKRVQNAIAVKEAKREQSK